MYYHVKNNVRFRPHITNCINSKQNLSVKSFGMTSLKNKTIK